MYYDFGHNSNKKRRYMPRSRDIDHTLTRFNIKI
ncbi:hypothetical protein SLEP1_g32236 [Rubroshorea leprosula]|uniref:Uncharacterized protein n=1 Tax=Rubroshorea leprosula TaxID=152421 RepID=A0AAV5KCW7_9ROSI|nr:hypothetical protein SLEP1_g32236 [Rubroshorea leprosula]